MPPKKRYQRKSKESRHSLKMWADGAREAILMPHIEAYSDALDCGWMAERTYLEKVCQEYHSRVDWRLADHEEPPLPLAPYDPTVILEPEKLSEEDLRLKTDRIKTLNERIRRWLKYRVKRSRCFAFSRMDPKKDPYALLLGKLSGLTTPPRARQAYQQFMRAQYHETVDPAIKLAWQEKIRHDHLSSDSTPNAAFRAKVARALFNKLPKSEQAHWQKMAKAEADEAKNEYEERLKNPMPRSLEERQKCIDGIPGFMGPIIQGIQAMTGLKFLLLYGGPFPCNAGEITTNHVNYGRNLAIEPGYFYQTRNFDTHVMREYKEWLKTCYTQANVDGARLEPRTDLSLAQYHFNDSDTDLDESSDSDVETSDEEQPIERKRKPEGKKRSRKPESTSPHPTSPRTTKACAPPTTSSPAASSSAAKNSSGPTTKTGSDASNVPVIDPASVEAIHMLTSPGPTTSTSGVVVEPEDASNVFPSGPPSSHSSRASTPSYSPYDASNPGGPLIPPNYSKYEQIKAYNIARNKRTLAQVEAQLQPPPKRQKSSDPQPARAIGNGDLPTPSNTPPESSTPMINSQLPPTATDRQESPSLVAPRIPSPLSVRARSPSDPTTQRRGFASSVTTEQPGPGPGPSQSTSLQSTSSLPATSSTAPIPDPLPKCPTAAPKWMHDSVSGLTKVSLGSDFTNILRLFIAIEACHGYDNPNRGLSAGRRPLSLSKWIGAGRWRAKDPVISAPDEFGIGWWEWWNSLQPAWRSIRRKRPVAMAEYGDNWDTLNHPGQNGILSVVVGLYWWGLAVNGAGVPGPAHKSWSAAVADVNWVLDGLLRHLESEHGQ